MISKANSFSNPAALKDRFRNAMAQKNEKQAQIDKLEQMAEGFMVLDQTEFDQDKDPGSVAVGNDQTLAYAQMNPFGGFISFDYLEEKNGETKEASIEMGLTGTLYTETINGVSTEVYQDGNGLLAMMEQLEAIKPKEKAKPEKGEKPDEADKPKEGDKPKEDEQPKESGKAA